MVADSIRRSQRWSGKSGGKLERPAMKWSLKVPMTRSAGFVRWSYGGTSCRAMLLAARNRLNAAEHSLSEICNLGWSPHAVRLSYSVSYASMREASARFFSGTARMALASWT